MPCVKNHLSAGNDLQTVLLLSSAFLCFFCIFGLASPDTLTVLTLSHLVPFLPILEVIPEIFRNFVKYGENHSEWHTSPNGFSENARNTGSDRGRNIAVHEVSTKNKYVMEKKIGIASDHAGYEMKEFLVGYLAAKGWDVLDFGPESEESVDYPDFAHPLANAIESGELERGIGLCGSGEGMAITLNKHQGIRAGLVWDKQIAHLIRQHNNANVIVLPARFITNDQAVEFVEEFLATDFEGGRHQRRIEKIPVKACSRQ